MNKQISLLMMALLMCGPYSNVRAQTPSPTAPDNSGINVRDRSNDAVTAGEQSNSGGDLKLTAKIRRAIVKDKSLSTMDP
jgi:hyperosmotically inducible periplasmic protein